MTADTYKSLCLGKAVHCLGQNYSELSDAIQRPNRYYEEFLGNTPLLTK